MNFGWLVIICETLWLVMWLRTRTYGRLCEDLCLCFYFAYLMACSSSCRVFEANPLLNFIGYIYVVVVLISIL
jgi:hypothetical protein